MTEDLFNRNGNNNPLKPDQRFERKLKERMRGKKKKQT